MFARHVSIHLKPNTLSDYTRTFDNEILPLLRKQKGFKDAMILSSPGSPDVIAISLWDSKASAEAFNKGTRPDVMHASATMVNGAPKVQTFEAVASTFHKLAASA